jgi:enediyne biosynthesis protein E5
MDNIARTIAGAAAVLRDPRSYQIAVLGLLLAYGVVALDFPIRWQNALAILATAQLVQFIGTRFVNGRFDPLSALVTSLSLTLLLRTDTAALAMIGATVAIGSKFLVRVRGKHIFNPSNLALVTLMLASDGAWVSSGQWGSTVLGALALACLGSVVITRARRSETTLAFLVAFAGLLIGRALWLEDPLRIPLHQLQNGALLVFAFFMISDPKTAPDTCAGRIVFGVLVATVAYVIQYILYQPNGPIIGLVLSAPFVPLIDAVSRGRVYQWKQPAGLAAEHRKGAYPCES